MATLEASWTVEIDAPRERCYEVAADVANSSRWQGTLEEVEVLERDAEGRALVVETVSDAMVKKVRSWLRFGYEPPGGMTWEQEKGEAKWLTGSWTFEELAGGRTRATYGAADRPGPGARPAPARAGRGKGQGAPDQERRRGPEEAG